MVEVDAEERFYLFFDILFIPPEPVAVDLKAGRRDPLVEVDQVDSALLDEKVFFLPFHYLFGKIVGLIKADGDGDNIGLQLCKGLVELVFYPDGEDSPDSDVFFYSFFLAEDGHYLHIPKLIDKVFVFECREVIDAVRHPFPDIAGDVLLNLADSGDCCNAIKPPVGVSQVPVRACLKNSLRRSINPDGEIDSLR